MAWKIFYNDKKDSKEKKESEKTKVKKKEEKVQIIPLGGLGEIGKNMTLIQCGEEYIIIDTGLAFPGDEMLGIDLVIPDFSYIQKIKKSIKAVVLTHGHEDHIGGLPYLFREIDEETPIYGSRLTLALAKAKFESVNNKTNYNYQEVVARDKVKISENFEVEFVRVTHSIAGAFALAIHTPAGTIVHSGDFKVDLTPVNGEPMDFYKLAELGEKGVLCLLADSTNAEVEGYTLSEREVGESLRESFEKAKGRIIIAAFASHVDRVQQIIDVAIEAGRKIAIDGRSMVKVVDIATTLGYLKAEKDMFISLKEVEALPDNEVVILCTGTQGEPMAALSRIANRMHKHISIRKGDTVIISATPIPGNEKAVYNNINNLLKNNAEVIYEKVAGVHTSGHASKEDLKLMLNLIKPKYFMPVHGEYKHLKKHKEIALDIGISEKDIVIAQNGSRVEVSDKNGIKIKGKVQAGITLIDGLGVGDIGNIVLRDRQHLAQDGIVIVVLTISGTDGKIMAGPDLITRGFVYARESEDLIKETENKIKEELRKCEEKNVIEWAVLKQAVKTSTSNFLYAKIQRRPIILPIIMEV